MYYKYIGVYDTFMSVLHMHKLAQAVPLRGAVTVFGIGRAVFHQRNRHSPQGQSPKERGKVAQ